MLSDRQKIGIVIPCFNESARLPTDELRNCLNLLGDVHFMFVNDGSTDDTAKILHAIRKEFPKRIEVIHLKRNRGKAEAVRTGMKRLLEGRVGCMLLGYWDSDMSTPLSELPSFIELFCKKPEIGVVIGSRIRRMGAEIDRFWYRHYIGRIFATAASLLLKLPVYDTQCGAKMMRPEFAKIAFDAPFSTRWLFDVEIFARLSQTLGVERVKEVIFELPLTRWVEKGKSKMTPITYVDAPFALFRIYRKYFKSNRRRYF